MKGKSIGSIACSIGFGWTIGCWLGDVVLRAGEKLLYDWVTTKARESDGICREICDRGGIKYDKVHTSQVKAKVGFDY